MAIVNRHLRATLRFVDSERDTINSYQHINPAIQPAQVDNFLQAINGLTDRTGGNAFLTVTSELLEEIV